MTAADPDLPGLSDVLSIYKRGRASGRQTGWLRSEPEPRWEARPALPAAQSWGQPHEPLHPSFPQKKSLDKLLARASGQRFSACRCSWDCPGHRNHQGLSRLADVSRVPLNELHLFISQHNSGLAPGSLSLFISSSTTKKLHLSQSGATAKLRMVSVPRQCSCH